ncbi:MAG: hypothetical protein PHT32_03550, partial [Candidatus Omnitrophica bacterium]|nr:hypothetical protein [Candidatus Omnitrophota bacterium]
MSKTGISMEAALGLKLQTVMQALNKGDDGKWSVDGEKAQTVWASLTSNAALNDARALIARTGISMEAALGLKLQTIMQSLSKGNDGKWSVDGEKAQTAWASLTSDAALTDARALMAKTGISMEAALGLKLQTIMQALSKGSDGKWSVDAAKAQTVWASLTSDAALTDARALSARTGISMEAALGLKLQTIMQSLSKGNDGKWSVDGEKAQTAWASLTSDAALTDARTLMAKTGISMEAALGLKLQTIMQSLSKGADNKWSVDATKAQTAWASLTSDAALNDARTLMAKTGVSMEAALGLKLQTIMQALSKGSDGKWSVDAAKAQTAWASLTSDAALTDARALMAKAGISMEGVLGLKLQTIIQSLTKGADGKWSVDGEKTQTAWAALTSDAALSDARALMAKTGISMEAALGLKLQTIMQSLSKGADNKWSVAAEKAQTAWASLTSDVALSSARALMNKAGISMEAALGLKLQTIMQSLSKGTDGKWSVDTAKAQAAWGSLTSDAVLADARTLMAKTGISMEAALGLKLQTIMQSLSKGKDGTWSVDAAKAQTAWASLTSDAALTDARALMAKTGISMEAALGLKLQTIMQSLNKGKDGTWSVDAEKTQTAWASLTSDAALRNTRTLMAKTGISMEAALGLKLQTIMPALRKGNDGRWSIDAEKAQTAWAALTSDTAIADARSLMAKAGISMEAALGLKLQSIMPALRKGNDGKWSIDAEKVETAWAALVSDAALSDARALMAKTGISMEAALGLKLQTIMQSLSKSADSKWLVDAEKAQAAWAALTSDAALNDARTLIGKTGISMEAALGLKLQIIMSALSKGTDGKFSIDAEKAKTAWAALISDDAIADARALMAKTGISMEAALGLKLQIIMPSLDKGANGKWSIDADKALTAWAALTSDDAIADARALMAKTGISMEAALGLKLQIIMQSLNKGANGKWSIDADKAQTAWASLTSDASLARARALMAKAGISMEGALGLKLQSILRAMSQGANGKWSVDMATAANVWAQLSSDESLKDARDIAAKTGASLEAILSQKLDKLVLILALAAAQRAGLLTMTREQIDAVIQNLGKSMNTRLLNLAKALDKRDPAKITNPVERAIYNARRIILARQGDTWQAFADYLNGSQASAEDKKLLGPSKQLLRAFIREHVLELPLQERGLNVSKEEDGLNCVGIHYIAATIAEKFGINWQMVYVNGLRTLHVALIDVDTREFMDLTIKGKSRDGLKARYQDALGANKSFNDVSITFLVKKAGKWESVTLALKDLWDDKGGWKGTMPAGAQEIRAFSARAVLLYETIKAEKFDQALAPFNRMIAALKNGDNKAALAFAEEAAQAFNKLKLDPAGKDKIKGLANFDSFDTMIPGCGRLMKNIDNCLDIIEYVKANKDKAFTVDLNADGSLKSLAAGGGKRELELLKEQNLIQPAGANIFVVELRKGTAVQARDLLGFTIEQTEGETIKLRVILDTSSGALICLDKFVLTAGEGRKGKLQIQAGAVLSISPTGLNILQGQALVLEDWGTRKTDVEFKQPERGPPAGAAGKRETKGTNVITASMQDGELVVHRDSMVTLSEGAFVLTGNDVIVNRGVKGSILIRGIGAIDVNSAGAVVENTLVIAKLATDAAGNVSGSGERVLGKIEAKHVIDNIAIERLAILTVKGAKNKDGSISYEAAVNTRLTQDGKTVKAVRTTLDGKYVAILEVMENNKPVLIVSKEAIKHGISVPAVTNGRLYLRVKTSGEYDSTHMRFIEISGSLTVERDFSFVGGGKVPLETTVDQRQRSKAIKVRLDFMTGTLTTTEAVTIACSESLRFEMKAGATLAVREDGRVEILRAKYTVTGAVDYETNVRADAANANEGMNYLAQLGGKGGAGKGMNEIKVRVSKNGNIVILKGQTFTEDRGKFVLESNEVLTNASTDGKTIALFIGNERHVLAAGESGAVHNDRYFVKCGAGEVAAGVYRSAEEMINGVAVMAFAKLDRDKEGKLSLTTINRQGGEVISFMLKGWDGKYRAVTLREVNGQKQLRLTFNQGSLDTGTDAPGKGIVLTDAQNNTWTFTVLNATSMQVDIKTKDGKPIGTVVNGEALSFSELSIKITSEGFETLSDIAATKKCIYSIETADGIRTNEGHYKLIQGAVVRFNENGEMVVARGRMELTGAATLDVTSGMAEVLERGGPGGTPGDPKGPPKRIHIARAKDGEVILYGGAVEIRDGQAVATLGQTFIHGGGDLTGFQLGSVIVGANELNGGKSCTYTDIEGVKKLTEIDFEGVIRDHYYRDDQELKQLRLYVMAIERNLSGADLETFKAAKAKYERSGYGSSFSLNLGEFIKDIRSISFTRTATSAYGDDYEKTQTVEGYITDRFIDDGVNRKDIWKSRPILVNKDENNHYLLPRLRATEDVELDYAKYALATVYGCEKVNFDMTREDFLTTFREISVYEHTAWACVSTKLDQYDSLLAKVEAKEISILEFIAGASKLTDKDVGLYGRTTINMDSWITELGFTGNNAVSAELKALLGEYGKATREGNFEKADYITIKIGFQQYAESTENLITQKLIDKDEIARMAGGVTAGAIMAKMVSDNKFAEFMKSKVDSVMARERGMQFTTRQYFWYKTFNTMTGAERLENASDARVVWGAVKGSLILVAGGLSGGSLLSGSLGWGV